MEIETCSPMRKNNDNDVYEVEIMEKCKTERIYIRCGRKKEKGSGYVTCLGLTTQASRSPPESAARWQHRPHRVVVAQKQNLEE